MSWKAESIEVVLPSGRRVMLAPLFGRTVLAVDIDFAREPAEVQAWKFAEILARRITAIDGKPMTGYTHKRLLMEFPDRDVRALVTAAAQFDNPTPEELAAALSGQVAAEVLQEAVALYRLSGGAMSFEQALELDAKRRKLMLAVFAAQDKPAEGAEVE